MKKSTASFFAIALCGLMATSMISTAHAARGQFAHRHPRRAEVLGRDNNMRHELREDHGHLGGNYNHLMAEDKSIHRQERRDARRDGGHITQQQQNHLNREENRMNRQIHRDDRGY